ncbi:MAG: Imm8 family immunity protein [Myxococcota bacterium]
MRPKLKRLSSSDVEIFWWEPETLADVYFQLALEIGEPDTVGQHLFYVTVATPEGLRAHARGAVMSDRAVLVLSEFSLSTLRKHIATILERCEGWNWGECSTKLQRYFAWEYEDHK